MTSASHIQEFMYGSTEDPNLEQSGILKSKISFLFKENRGQSSYNLENIAKTLWGVWVMANEIEEIKELDINPLLVYNDERKDVAVDIKIII